MPFPLPPAPPTGILERPGAVAVRGRPGSADAGGREVAVPYHGGIPVSLCGTLALGPARATPTDTGTNAATGVWDMGMSEDVHPAKIRVPIRFLL